MFNRCFKKSPRIIAVLGFVLSILMAGTACFAGGAATIVMDKHQLAPRGSYIPERRVEQVVKKIEEHKNFIKRKTIQKTKLQT